MTRRRLVIAAVLAGALLAPVASGTLPDDVLAFYLTIAAAVVALAVVPSGPRARRYVTRILLVSATLALGAALVDTAARALVFGRLEHRPYELYGGPWDRLPVVGRYAPNVRYTGRTYGALAQASVFRAYREYRDVLFVTDAHGFPNDPAAIGRGPYEVILLGDSFGEGSQTSHDRTWAYLLRTRYGRSVYNLSMAAASPWHEYVTLASEIDRLATRPSSVVVWAIFTGNDFDGGVFYPEFDLARLPWQAGMGRVWTRYQHMRDRSPVRRAAARIRASRAGPAEPIVARPFIDGGAMLFFTPYAARMRATPAMIRAHPSFTLFRETIVRTVALARARKLDLAIVLIPSKEEVYRWVLERQPPWSSDPSPSGLGVVLTEICREADVRLLDLKAPLIEESRRRYQRTHELLWWRDDDHWNEAGHEVAAALVEARVLTTR